MKLPNVEKAIIKHVGGLQRFLVIADAITTGGKFPRHSPRESPSRWELRVIKKNPDESLELKIHTETDEKDGTVIRGDTLRFRFSLNTDGTADFEPLSYTPPPPGLIMTLVSPQSPTERARTKDFIEQIASGFDDSLAEPETRQ